MLCEAVVQAVMAVACRVPPEDLVIDSEPASEPESVVWSNDRNFLLTAWVVPREVPVLVPTLERQ